MKKIFFTSIAALMLLGACGKPAVYKFNPIMVPATLQENQVWSYMQTHYWDNVPFENAEFFLHADTASMVGAYVQYVGQFVPWNEADSLMTGLMKKASVNKPATEFFAMLADKALYFTESPVRSDEHYIPVLEALVASPWFDQYEKLPFEHRLRIAQQNRIGNPANDFTYTLASGRTGTLYGIRTPYTLLYLNNPGCPMCLEIIDGLRNSEVVNRLIREGKLTILALYPDEDLTAWRDHLKDFPSTWIVSYDKGTVISNKALYDLRAIPSIYILNAKKTVIGKDLYNVQHVDYVLTQELGQ